MAANRVGGEDRAESLAEWLTLHGKKVGLVAIVVAVAVGGVFVYRQTREATIARAEAAYFQAQASAAGGNVQLAQSDLGRVIEQYRGTPAATQAAILLAQTQYDQGQYDQGLQVLRQVEGDAASREFAAALQALIAAGLEGKNDYAAAAQQYLTAAEATPFPLEQQTYRADAARVYGLAGNTAEAVRLWQEIADTPDSPLAAEARVRLGELTASAVS